MKDSEYKSFEEFEKDFSLSENAIDMRQLIRWNGRDIPQKENLAEHTHHVVCLLYEIIDKYNHICHFSDDSIVRMTRCALLHDASEVYFGDILASTKNTYPQIRELVDSQEDEFMKRQVPGLTDKEESVVNYADKLSCNKFMEYMISSNLCNDYIKSIYQNTLTWVSQAKDRFYLKYHIPIEIEDDVELTNRLSKGYIDDAGTDILLDHDVTFLPHSVTEVKLNWNYNPKHGYMGLLLLRSSAGVKGLSINTSPIDPGFEGNTTAIIQNNSNNIITYKKGEAFCQLIVIPFETVDAIVRKSGSRGEGKYGSSGKSGTVSN